MAREAIEEALEELGFKGRRVPEAVREHARAALRKLVAAAEAENECLRRSLEMSCVEPAEDCACAGCLYAAEVHAQAPAGERR